MNFLFCYGGSPHPVCCRRPETPDVGCARFPVGVTSPPSFDVLHIREQMTHKRLGYGRRVLWESVALASRKSHPRLAEQRAPGNLECPALRRRRIAVSRLETAPDARTASGPSAPPKGEVLTSSQEWFSIIAAGLALGRFAVVDEADILRDLDGTLVLNGVMGLQRLLNMVPSNACWRRLCGDSHPPPPVSRMGCIQLEDMTSTFHVFRLPPTWKRIIP